MATLTEWRSRGARAQSEASASRRAGSVWQRVLGVREAPRALDAAHHDLDITLIGRVGYYVDAHTRGRPIVLVHAIHPAASAFDVKPLFDALRGERPVYAPDLPGFGTSDRGPNTYCPILYAKALKRFLIDVVSPREDAVDVVALGLSCELVARAAIEEPRLFRTITMIAPSGLGAREDRRASMRRATRLERWLRFPLWAAPSYRVITSKLAVRRALGRRFAGKLPRPYLDHAVRTARVPGAHHAPFAHAAGCLATAEAYRTLYERLRVPTLVIHDDAPGIDARRVEDLVRRNPALRSQRIVGTRGMPHFERRDEVLRAIRDLHEETRRGEEAEARA